VDVALPLDPSRDFLVATELVNAVVSIEAGGDLLSAAEFVDVAEERFPRCWFFGYVDKDRCPLCC
jgi:hypothetical protein